MPQRFFLDTSALIVRYLRRAVGHAWVQHICDDASHNTITIAEITEAELAATMNQLVRGGLMRASSCKRSLAVFWRQVDGNEYRILHVTSPIIRRAAGLCAVHSLKGYDAARAEGFTVDTPAAHP